MVVSFIGHRDIEDRGGVYKKIRAVMRELIVCRAAEVFLFGSRSDFDSLCVKAAKELKSELYAHSCNTRSEGAACSNGKQSARLAGNVAPPPSLRVFLPHSGRVQSS